MTGGSIERLAHTHLGTLGEAAYRDFSPAMNSGSSILAARQYHSRKPHPPTTSEEQIPSQEPVYRPENAQTSDYVDPSIPTPTVYR